MPCVQRASSHSAQGPSWPFSLTVVAVAVFRAGSYVTFAPCTVHLASPELARENFLCLRLLVTRLVFVEILRLLVVVPRNSFLGRQQPG